MASLSITELDAAGLTVTTQLVQINTPYPIPPQTVLGMSATQPATGGGTLSAPFKPNTTSLLLNPGSATATVTFGTAPTPSANGIVITGPQTLAAQGARLAVL